MDTATINLTVEQLFLLKVASIRLKSEMIERDGSNAETLDAVGKVSSLIALLQSIEGNLIFNQTTH